jgi:hypothetical protein
MVINVYSINQVIVIYGPLTHNRIDLQINSMVMESKKYLKIYELGYLHSI